MDDTAIGRVRRFQRTVTQRIGALNDGFLARGRALGQARVLWEIGAEGSEIRALRARLELDSGYMSRLLRSLEADGLVEVGGAGPDGRVRTARLTAAGLAERAELDRRSDEVAASILRPLSGTQRERLVAAMSEVERLLIASMVEVKVLDPRHPHARHCLRAYFAELARRFDDGYDPARGIPAGDEEVRLPAGMFLVAMLHAEPVGCVAVKLHPASRAGSGWAEIKRMWVDPTARRLGLGRRLLAEAEGRAAGHGARTLRLETNRALTEAVALYRAAGYEEVAAFNDEPYAHHWFEKRLLR
ncbi:bifunctional helix-turn-helix transcriptional regulator/GNAT family N-acetyltransferase [Nonomuraea sp. NPDC048882]|uniref:bifunctional helix-turn-helix transcriptional regulator/GNAT family N-acetyltransferase n=1 Tax=Nonomuraea sp. NPDC048882 TaxID=3154347 RepID=UPI000B260C44